MNKLETVDFDLNVAKDGKFHIHNEECYVMLRKNGVGLALISRALAAYHHYGLAIDDSKSVVGDPHEICIIREKLQGQRFQLL